jgi:hypothetical protein
MIVALGLLIVPQGAKLVSYFRGRKLEVDKAS